MNRTEHPFLDILNWKNQVLWQLLAFHAGYLNVAGLMSSHRFVSHVTGFGSSIGVSLSRAHYLHALEIAIAPICFIIGAGYAGYLIDRKFVSDRIPKILNGVLCIIFLNLAVLIGGLSDIFGEFGEPLVLQRDFALLFILTFTCGLQNGMFASLTGGQIRTTHITGVATDLGLTVVKNFSNTDEVSRDIDRRKNFVRICTLICFAGGSFVSAVTFHNLKYWGFAGSVLISILIFGLVYHIVSEFNSRRSMASTQTITG